MTADAGTFGSPEQVRLQYKSIDMREQIESTPGLCHTGRLVGSDDPSALGWDFFEEHLKEDGFVGFRCLLPERAHAVRVWGAKLGGIHEWAVMLGTSEDLRASATAIGQRPLSSGFRDVGPEEMAADASLSQMQALLVDAGIAPLARASLRGDIYPSACVGVSGPDGSLVAVANVAMPFNRFSEWQDAAWIGLVAVAPGCRGLGLGARVSAAAALAGLEKLGARRAMAFVADDNAPSRAMLLRIGLQVSTLRSIIVGHRPTR
ncbi:GNAT family N-acetyltransferase [Albidovulum sediminis]|uniref:GNAT family N-acetyltransferase n=1 Tax=Albidovulum sediminis TaxID=3066345 RepID=A0ABT2NKY9_9RHOB|nr:GNAT family N-acetyltransferase [Defluviimonas sediminis]MCT8328619.1 GNAT family N-acetyltransferase [Defluviimonas sediminis]